MKTIGALGLLMTIALVASSALGESKSEPKIEDIFRQALVKEFTPGREVIVSLVEVPPNTAIERLASRRGVPLLP